MGKKVLSGLNQCKLFISGAMYLNNHSYYSLRYGTISVEKLVDMAALSGLKTLALTDINNTTGVFDFIKSCKELQIKPVAGMEFRNKHHLLYIALARNNEGFQEMNEFLSEHQLAEKELPETAPAFKNIFLIYPYGKRKTEELRENEYIGISPKDLNKVNLRNESKKEKVVIRHAVTFADQNGYILHKHLRAIDNNLLLSRLNPAIVAGETECMLPPQAYNKLYKDFPEAVKNTERLLEKCEIEFLFKESKNKKTFYGCGWEDMHRLQQLAKQGMIARYGSFNKQAETRVQKELEIISSMGFVSYFLITWDMVMESKRRGFYHVGRGSGANSIVAYCLTITDVDPLELDLYFERFLNPKRSVPPDFDIDYCWKDRDQMFQYLFDKHGSKHVALLGTISTFKSNSFLRELGKVYGLPKSEIDMLANRPDLATKNNKLAKQIVEIGAQMKDFPNIRSIHAGGVLIGERPINYYSPVDLPPKGFPTVQWDMYVAEMINFEKLDVLSQRGIGHIKDSVEIIRKNKGIEIDIHEVERFKNDPQVKAKLKEGTTIGCFYIESPAMRQLLKKLTCDNFIHLVAASSIIRPGVASSGMMGQFIYRFHHPDKFEYLHPVLEEQLGETFGVMVYQEDVLKICHHYAGLDLADADLLRRVMSGKFRSKDAFEILVSKFFEGAKNLGRPEKITEEIWRQTSSFGGYSFCKAHSASFAVESFQSLFLKTYFPLEFMVAVINNFGGFYTTWVYIKEAIKGGAKIELPCINRSEILTTIDGATIYLGFTHIQNLENQLAAFIQYERTTNGLYASLPEFVKRTAITREQLFILIKLGALRCFGKKKMLLWEATLHITGEHKKDQKNKTGVLFGERVKEFSLPVLEESVVEDVYDEIELLGYPITISEFELLQTRYRGNTEVISLEKMEGKSVRLTGNLVATKDIRTKTGKSMKFGTFLDEQNNFFDTVHFTQAVISYPFTGRGVYLIEGKVVCDFGVPAIDVKKMARLPYKPDPRQG